MTSDPTIEAEVIEIVQDRVQEQVRDAVPKPADNWAAQYKQRQQDHPHEPFQSLLPEEAGISMCIGVVHRNRSEMLECERLCGIEPTYRMTCLLDLYPDIPAKSPLRAKAAFVLAMFVWDEHQDSERAEEH